MSHNKQSSWADEDHAPAPTTKQSSTSIPKAASPTSAPTRVELPDGCTLITEPLPDGNTSIKVVRRIHDHVKNWVPFGRAADPKSSEISDKGDPVVLFLSTEGRNTHSAASEKVSSKALLDIDAQLKREQIRADARLKAEATKQQVAEAQAAEKDKPATFKARGGGSGTGNSMGKPGGQEVCSLRVSNLSEDTREEALKLLCNRIGRVSKVYVPTQTTTDSQGQIYKKNKGVAYVTFATKKEAEEALVKLDKLPFQGSLLCVEWGNK
eukprot:PhF_6_TR5220/c0_g1_i2/m.7533/K03248/EIF3G; translation initiation factor 3 subunit G